MTDELYSGQVPCEGCGEPIIWAWHFDKGRLVPLGCKNDNRGGLLVYWFRDAVPVAREIGADESRERDVLFRNHWEVCSAAKDYREDLERRTTDALSEAKGILDGQTRPEAARIGDVLDVRKKRERLDEV
jgi:hypothetical protein